MQEQLQTSKLDLDQQQVRQKVLKKQKLINLNQKYETIDYQVLNKDL